MYKSYRPKFDQVPGVFMGLEVGKFLEAMREALRPVLEAEPLPERGGIEVDLARTPRIELVYYPSENGEAQRYSPEKF